jgi:hypothetical protein
MNNSAIRIEGYYNQLTPEEAKIFAQGQSMTLGCLSIEFQKLLIESGVSDNLAKSVIQHLAAKALKESMTPEQIDRFYQAQMRLVDIHEANRRAIRETN